MKLKFVIKNFKSIKNTELILRKGVNILIGPNGSGKTCVLSSLQFVRDVFRFGSAQALARSGGAKRVYRRNASKMVFSMSDDYGKRVYRRKPHPCKFYWEIQIAQAGEEKIATVVKESFVIKCNVANSEKQMFLLEIDRSKSIKGKTKMELCDHSLFGRDLFSVWDVYFKKRNKTQIVEAFKNEILKHILDTATNSPDKSFFSEIVNLDRKITGVYNHFLFLNEYNILPDIARAATEQLPYSQMTPNGGSVSEVIHALENKHFGKLEEADYAYMEDYHRIPYFLRSSYPYPRYMFRHRYYRHRGKGSEIDAALDNINRELSAAVKPISSISVAIDPTSGKRFVVFKSEDNTFYPEEVSDGTVKWLCILVSLFVPFSKVYLLEEPENFLHPWMQQRLIDIMREQSEKNDTIFLLSSHSSTILNAAYPSEVLVVKQDSSGTQLTNIESEEELSQILSQSDFQLGDLWVSGAIGGVPADE